MTYKNGIYLSLNCDSAVRIISENGSRIQTGEKVVSARLIIQGRFQGNYTRA
ncbi:MAG: hypothetical protein J1F28_09890 [Oscillospiraceae bacterium]|nr:hypothetical protein [Oscillospiraceae bacterium]